MSRTRAVKRRPVDFLEDESRKDSCQLRVCSTTASYKTMSRINNHTSLWTCSAVRSVRKDGRWLATSRDSQIIFRYPARLALERSREYCTYRGTRTCSAIRKHKRDLFSTYRCRVVDPSASGLPIANYAGSGVLKVIQLDCNLHCGTHTALESLNNSSTTSVPEKQAKLSF